jgi:hypothetical protein
MNDKISLLMKQANYPAPEMALRAQKLAKMIVFECIKIAVFKGDTATAKAIKEEFNIEE